MDTTEKSRHLLSREAFVTKPEIGGPAARHEALQLSFQGYAIPGGQFFMRSEETSIGIVYPTTGQIASHHAPASGE